MFFAQNINLKQTVGFGYLYNWYAASDINFAPTGWHVPTYDEFSTLITTLGGDTIAGGYLKETGIIYWNTPNTGADNSSGLTILGTGTRDGSGYNNRLNYAFLWSKTENDSSTGISLNLEYNSAFAYIVGYIKYSGCPIRLIKNDNIDPGTMTDPSGNIYTTIKIGDQVWIAQDYRATKKGNGIAIPFVTDQTTWTALVTPAYCIYP